MTIETTQAHPVFETGKAGIYFTGPYNMARFDKNLGADKYEVVAAPTGPGGGVRRRSAEGENIYLMAGSKNQAGQEQASPSSPSRWRARPSAWPATPTATSSGSRSTRRCTLASVRKDTRWDVFDKVYKETGRYSPGRARLGPVPAGVRGDHQRRRRQLRLRRQAELTKLAETFQQELTKQDVAWLDDARRATAGGCAQRTRPAHPQAAPAPAAWQPRRLGVPRARA